jgi:hypothetical protein
MSQHIKATGKTFDIVLTISECNNQLRFLNDIFIKHFTDLAISHDLLTMKEKSKDNDL